MLLMPSFKSLPAAGVSRHLLSLSCALLVAGFGLSGCGMGPISSSSTATAATAPAFHGSVHGGQQPVTGAQVFLYAASTTANAGAAASLLTTPGGYVTTDANGGFSITGDYTCPTGAYVYLLALGGNPGLSAGTNNAQLALAAGLGPCSGLSPSQFITINEVTTVAAAYSLAGVAASETQVGSANPTTLATAFGNIPNLVNTASGTANTRTPTGNGIVPQAKLDSLGNSLAACVNSDGTGILCQNLMSAANLTAGSGLPLDTFQAALSIALQPSVNVPSIYNLATPAQPFNPALSSAPGDWTLPIVYPGTTGYPGTVSVALAPTGAVITQTAQQFLTATASNSVALSYLWTTTGSAGSLTEVGGLSRTGQKSYCSSSAQARYVPAGSPALSASTADTVSVQAFAAPACVSAASLGIASSPVTVALPSSIDGIPTVNKTMTIVLPSGSQLTPDQLLVVDDAGTATPAASGTFTLPLFNNGEQIALVLSPAGTPMMMGWMDAAHSTLSAETTAEVLAYFALGGWQMFKESDRNEVIGQIPNLPGTASLAQTISSELAANPNALAQSDAPISNALDALFKSVSGITPYGKRGSGGVAPLDVITDPSASTRQSGVSLISQNPFSAFMTNAFRRRTHAFVVHVKDTLKGQDTLVNAPVMDFDLSPASGLSSGVVGAFSDIFQSYFGNQPSAYTPVSTDPFPLPLASGFDSSTYQIINVGPGSPFDPPIALNATQQHQLVVTSINDFVLDAVFPFVANVVIGSGFLGDGNNSIVTGAADSRGKLLLRLEQDTLAIVGNIPGEQDKIASGDYKGALNDLLFGELSTAFQASLVDALNAIGGPGTDVEAKSPITIAAKSFSAAMGAAGGVLQIYDSSVLATQIAASNAVELWTVTSVPTKAVLSPQNPTINSVGYVILNVTVPSVDQSAQAGYSYQWSITPASGQSLIGNVTPADGSGRQDLTATFCSSSNSVTYDNTSAAVQNLSTSGTSGIDTVSVTVFTGASCAAATKLTTTVGAMVTTVPGAGLGIGPSQYNTINPGAALPLTAVYSDPTVTPGSYQWTLQPGGSTAAGTLSGQGSAGTNTFCSTSPNATYQSTTMAPLKSRQQDSVTVTAYTGAGCSGGTNNTSLGTTGAIVVTSSVPLFIVTPTVTVQPGTQVTVTGAFPLYLGQTGTTTPKSYLWSTTGVYGTLTGPGANGNSYCSTSATQTFNVAPNASLSQNVADTVSATPFGDAACTPSQQVGGTGQATINIEAPPGPFVAPGPIANVIESGDGFFYATTTITCGYSNTDSCDEILRIDPAGAVTVLHTSELSYDTSYCPKDIRGYCTNADGSSVQSLIEGKDGNLYGTMKSGGTSANGTVFKLAKDGTYTVLYSFPEVITGVSGGHPRGGAVYCDRYYVGANYASPTGAGPGPLLEGADGNFYGTAMGGYAYGNSAGGVFYKLSPDGSFSLLHTFLRSYTYITGGGTGVCGDPYHTYGTIYVDPFDFTNLGTAPPLLQANDGNFYLQLGIVPNGGYYAESSLIQFAPGGNYNVVSTVNQNPSYSPFIEGPNNLLYGINGAGAFNETTGGSLQQITTTYDPLAVLGSDGNFYGAGSNALVQTTPTGSMATLGPVSDPDPNATITYPGATGSLIEASDGRLAGGAEGYNANNKLVYFLFDNALSPTLNGPIQLSFPQATAPPNRPVTLTWKVLNAFSLSAQQCHATVLDGTAGAGTWSGSQTGTLQGTVYTGSATITPTAPGTYTYGLTCGGTESGFTTLTVQ